MTESYNLAVQAIDHLAEFLTGASTAAGRRAGMALYDVISERLKRAGESSTLDQFESQPKNVAWKANLREALSRELGRDPEFSQSLQTAIEQYRPLVSYASSDSRTGGLSVSASGSSQAAGRDLSISNSTSTTRKNNYGGLVVAVMAVVVVIVVVWIGHAVYVNVIAPAVQKAEQPVTRSTTCREYLALPEGERADAVRKLLLAEGKSEAGDPFLLQNTDYACGSALNMTIGQLIDHWK
jgi:hypothetical protein